MKRKQDDLDPQPSPPKKAYLERVTAMLSSSHTGPFVACTGEGNVVMGSIKEYAPHERLLVEQELTSVAIRYPKVYLPLHEHMVDECSVHLKFNRDAQHMPLFALSWEARAFPPTLVTVDSLERLEAEATTYVGVTQPLLVFAKVMGGLARWMREVLAMKDDFWIFNRRGMDTKEASEILRHHLYVQNYSTRRIAEPYNLLVVPKIFSPKEALQNSYRPAIPKQEVPLCKVLWRFARDWLEYPPLNALAKYSDRGYKKQTLPQKSLLHLVHLMLHLFSRPAEIAFRQGANLSFVDALSREILEKAVSPNCRHWPSLQWAPFARKTAVWQTMQKEQNLEKDRCPLSEHTRVEEALSVWKAAEIDYSGRGLAPSAYTTDPVFKKRPLALLLDWDNIEGGKVGFEVCFFCTPPSPLPPMSLARQWRNMIKNTQREMADKLLEEEIVGARATSAHFRTVMSAFGTQLNHLLRQLAAADVEKWPPGFFSQSLSDYNVKLDPTLWIRGKKIRGLIVERDGGRRDFLCELAEVLVQLVIECQPLQDSLDSLVQVYGERLYLVPCSCQLETVLLVALLTDRGSRITLQELLKHRFWQAWLDCGEFSQTADALLRRWSSRWFLRRELEYVLPLSTERFPDEVPLILGSETRQLRTEGDCTEVIAALTAYMGHGTDISMLHNFHPIPVRFSRAGGERAGGEGNSNTREVVLEDGDTNEEGYGDGVVQEAITLFNRSLEKVALYTPDKTPDKRGDTDEDVWYALGNLVKYCLVQDMQLYLDKPRWFFDVMMHGVRGARFTIHDVALCNGRQTAVHLLDLFFMTDEQLKAACLDLSDLSTAAGDLYWGDLTQGTVKLYLQLMCARYCLQKYDWSHLTVMTQGFLSTSVQAALDPEILCHRFGGKLKSGVSFEELDKTIAVADSDTSTVRHGGKCDHGTRHVYSVEVLGERYTCFCGISLLMGYLKEATDEERGQFLQFATGSASLPPRTEAPAKYDITSYQVILHNDDLYALKGDTASRFPAAATCSRSVNVYPLVFKGTGPSIEAITKEFSRLIRESVSCTHFELL